VSLIEEEETERKRTGKNKINTKKGLENAEI